MANILQENKVIYIEPNAIDGMTLPNDSTDGSYVYKTPNEEDMCTVVDLEVELKGRTYNGSTDGNSENIQMEWQSSTTGQTINFMKGSKIYTDSSKTSYINSLTTSYTDIYLKDIQNHGTAEMFGIKSIDIAYNNFMIPEVTIQFVDVRGVSLFAQEEMRHNIVRDGISATANPDIEGSFFKAFFSFPYPKFTLKVKGFYGKMVAYELSCTDFRAEFDSNAGNFNVTAKFLGYGFSFLNDLTVNALVAAPYCEYDGKKYWEDNLGTRFKVTDKNGAEVSMVKLGDIVKKFNEIQQSVNQALQEEGYIEPKPGATSTTNTSGNTSGETKDTRSADITQLKADYEALIQKLHQIKPPSPNNGDCMIRVEGSNSFCLITNYDNKEIEGYREAINILNNNIDKYNVKELIEWKKKNNSNTNGGLRLLKFDDYIGEEEEKLTDDAKNIYEDFYNQEKNKYSSVIIENGLKNAITTKGNSKIKSDSDKTYAGLWSNCDASTVYVYQDLGLKDILAGASKEKEAEEVDKTVDERATELMVEKFAETFDFVPSLENITKVIMAHVETYIHMISSCAESIISKGNARSVSSLGVSLDSFPDAKGNSSTSSNENVVIAPFPKVTTVVTQEGIEKTEDAWLGSLSDGTKFEEVSLVEGLLKGVENVGKEFSIQAAIDSGQAIGEDISSNLVKPLSYLDLFMGEDDNPFGKDIDIKNIYNVLAHFAVRCFSLYASSNDLTNGDNKTEIFKTFGNLDSENFLNIYKSNPNLEGLKEALQSDKTASDYFKYLTESTDGCWYTKHALLKENHYTYGYYYHLNLCQINGGCSVAVKNWSFKEWKRDSNSVLKKTETPSYILTCTPLLGGKYQTNIYRDDSNAFYIKENAVPYIKNVMQSIENDQNIGISLDDLKKETTFDSGTCADNFGLWGKTTIDMSTAGGIYSTSMEGQNAKCGDIGVTWDENGNVTINDQLTGKFLEHVFLNEDYYITDNGIRTKEERAEYFLRRFFQQYTDKKEEERLSIEKALSIRQFDIYKNFAFKAKIELLYHGMLCYKYKTFGTLKPEIYNKLAKFYKTWLENNFAKIDANFAFKFKRNNKENITKAFKDIQSVLTKNTSAIQTKILEYVDASQFTKNYTANTGGWIRDSIKANSTPELTALLQDLFKIYAVSIPTRYYENKREITNSGQKTLIEIPYDNIKGYIEGVLQGLKERLGVISDGSTSDSVTTTLNLGGSNEDIKVGLYNHIKMLYDKWISSGHSIKEFTMEKMFYDEDHTFHFVDSFYNKIGKTIFLNVGSLANRVQASMSQSGYNLLSFLSDIYSQNKLLLLCLQNFMDLSKKENMSTMFKPIPYYEMEEPDNHPDIVVMYAYEASSKLDIEGSDYPDDTFYLNESTTWPSMITSKQASDLALPAFGVSYGQQYQHFFKNIEVSMNAPIVTEQSIKAQYQICGAGGNDENNGSRQTTIGQDLYTIYSNNSYTCTVTMMGCAWVQPMMYFVLMNVPMFRGSYQIIKVRHNLTPGNMTTTFTGVRMAKTATRTVKEFIAGGYNDSWGGSDMERFMNQNANIGNDCPWAYNSPINVEPSCGAQQSTSDNKSIDEYMSGLTSAIQASLTTSEAYSRVTVSMEKRKDNWMLLTAKGTNANNAMFDCILQTYGDWFDKLSWGCNNGAVSGDAYGVHVHVVTKAPSSHEIYIYSKDQAKTISVTKAEEINDSLKKSMIKFYRKSSIKNASKAKAIFKSITSMDDTTVTNIFELNCD